MREFLFYMSCPKGQCQAEMFGKNRIFDVICNDYTESNTNPEESEYKTSVDKWKYKHAYQDLGDILFKYKAVAFFDDDVEISTESINKLFNLGTQHNWNMWQSALTKESYSSWAHMFQRPGDFRFTNTIEIMMPFFSNYALKTCWESFNINYSAWGLDIAWYHLLNKEKIVIVDSIPATHTRPLRGYNRIMPSGKTPGEEAEMVFQHYNIRKNYQTF